MISGDFFAPLGAGFPSSSRVNHRTAENLTTVLACVEAIGCGVAGLPVCLYRRTPDGREEITDHPLFALVHQGPNPWQTWFDFVGWIVASTLLRGNGLAEVQRDGSGALVGLQPLLWDTSAVSVTRSRTLVYDVSDAAAALGAGAGNRRLLQDEVLHIRDRTDDGLIGRSRLSRARGAVTTALRTQRFAEKMWEHGTHPSGVLSTEVELPAEVLGKMRNEFNDLYAGTHNAAKVLVLDQGLKFSPLTVSPEDQELILSRRFGVEEIARLFGVPSLMLSDLTNSSFNNSEQMIRFFAQSTLSQWCRRIEAEFQRTVLEPGVLMEFDLQGLLRGDPATRWTANQIAVASGILTPNEVRQAEGYNPLPDGDTIRTAPAPAPPPSA